MITNSGSLRSLKPVFSDRHGGSDHIDTTLLGDRSEPSDRNAYDHSGRGTVN